MTRFTSRTTRTTPDWFCATRTVFRNPLFQVDRLMQQRGVELRALDVKINPVRPGNARRLIFHFRSDVDHDARIGICVPGADARDLRGRGIAPIGFSSDDPCFVSVVGGVLSAEIVLGVTGRASLAAEMDSGRFCRGALGVQFVQCGANFRRVRGMRMQRQKLFVSFLREHGIVQVFLLDVRDGQQRILAVLAGRIFAASETGRNRSRADNISRRRDRPSCGKVRPLH